MTHSDSPVQRRRVHYFSGFDPRGPAYYHRLCRDEAAKHQPQGGVLKVGRREKVSALTQRWQVRWQAAADAGEVVQTEHVFMRWDDLIRAHWSRSPWALVREFVQAYVGIVRDVDLRRVRRLYPTVALTGVMPAVFLIGTALLGLLLAWLLGLAIGAAWPGWGALGLLPGLAAVAAAWHWGAGRGLFWLLRIFIFVIRLGRGPIDGVDARTRAWVDDIVQRQQDDPVDEVLLVGHSVGTMMMVDAVDTLLHDPRWIGLQQGRPTAMLTLGQCHPFVALAPQAQGFRDAVRRLCLHPDLQWWDVTARIDPLCFHATHPLALSGTPHDDLRLPVLHSARFFHMYEAAHWARLRADKLQTHFLYLMTPDRVGNFHLTDVLYGPRRLARHIAAQGQP
jgi:hypothetical protein